MYFLCRKRKSVIVSRRFSFSFRGSWISGKMTFPMATLVRHACDSDEKSGVSIIDFLRFCELSGRALFTPLSPLYSPMFHVLASFILLVPSWQDKERTEWLPSTDSSLYPDRVSRVFFFLLLDDFLSNKNRYFVTVTEWRCCFVT